MKLKKVGLTSTLNEIMMFIIYITRMIIIQQKC